MEMKDSGITWLGEIPKHWGIQKLKYIFKIKKDIAGELGHNVLSVTQSGVKPKVMSDKGQFSMDYSKYQFVHAGEFVMNHMDLLTGWVDISEHKGVTSPDYRVFVNEHHEKAYSPYYKYIFQFCYFNRVFYGLGQGVSGFGRWRLPADMFLNFSLPVPPQAEQAAIAVYLDDQCAQIDCIIAETKASIEEYKKWKSAVIFEAVTKGIDPEAEMKDSGVKWIGKIPKHWKCCKQKHAIQLLNGRAFKDTEFAQEGCYRVLRVGNLFTNTKWYFSDLELDDSKYCEAGDLLYAWSASYGPHIWMGEKVIFHYHIWKTVLVSETDKSFAYYYLAALSSNIASESHGSAMAHVTMERMNNSYMAMPPIGEQRQIAAYLEKQCAAIDILISEKQALLTDLEAYKKSLIYEAVTGKRKVV